MLLIAFPHGLGRLLLASLWQPTEPLILPLTVSVLGGCAMAGPRLGPPPGQRSGPPPVGAVGLTADEVADATGLDPSQVGELVTYGLIAGRAVGGATYFDDDAVAVARLAAGFAHYGVEARHLRLHKHAAEREAGFIEQIVLPLLKQRNPEARQRAASTVSELEDLGRGLRAALVSRTLRDLLG